MHVFFSIQSIPLPAVLLLGAILQIQPDNVFEKSFGVRWDDS
jgi:hypothetical protein